MKPEQSTAVGKTNGSTNGQSAVLERLSHLPVEPNPALMEHAKERAMSVQNRTFTQRAFTNTTDRANGGNLQFADMLKSVTPDLDLYFKTLATTQGKNSG